MIGDDERVALERRKTRLKMVRHERDQDGLLAADVSNDGLSLPPRVPPSQAGDRADR